MVDVSSTAISIYSTPGCGWAVRNYAALIEKGVPFTVVMAKDAQGNKSKTVTLELVEPGLMSPKEYDRAIRDLVNFLDYMGEPAKHERKALGVKVIMFLLVFLIVAYMMKREFWKDIH